MSRSSKSPLRQDQLRQRKDVDNADIPEIIDRAERLRQHHNQKIEQDKKRSSIQDVKQVGRDLSIPDNFIEQAIVELRKERNKAKVAQQSEVEERQASNKAFRLWTSKVIRLLGVCWIDSVATRGSVALVCIGFYPGTGRANGT